MLLDLHICAEHALFYSYTVRAKLGSRVFVQWLGKLRTLGKCKAGSVPVRRVAVEGKLRYEQHLAPYVFYRQIHFAVFVLKDA